MPPIARRLGSIANRSYAMFSTILRSGTHQAELGVLRTDKSLIVFPILSSWALILVIASFAVPTGIYVSGLSDQIINRGFARRPRDVGHRLRLYFTSYFVMTLLQRCPKWLM
jgi:hypothetical protein